MLPESLEPRVGQRLRAIREGQLQRTLAPPAGTDLSSNDYLGLANHPRLKQAMTQAIEHGGVGSTGSRLLRGDREAFTDVERHFAAFKRTERALYFSSGYLANLAVLTTLPERGDVIFSDERNHASLIDGIRLSARRARRVSAQRHRARSRARFTSVPPAARRSWSRSRCSAWTATCRRWRTTPRCADRPAPRSSWTRRTPSAVTASAAAA